MTGYANARWINLRWAIALASYFVLLVLISVSAYRSNLPAVLDRIPHYDFFGHFFLIGFAAYLTHRALNRQRLLWGWLRLPIGPMAIASLTVFDELFQGLSPARTMSIIDFGANVLGILTFYGLDCWLRLRSSDHHSHH
jgi:hypothetical protein